MRSARKIAEVAIIAMLAALPTVANYPVDDDDEPGVTARVARVSFLEGEAKIRRLGEEQWEAVTRDLPLVEGDEIAVDDEARLELQLDKYQYVRLAENSYLKIVTLRENSVALSLSLGLMNVRATSFDKAVSSFEIDAPATTIAVQKAGAYRVDAGRDGAAEISVAVRDGGEARVYSGNSGFTLRSGRGAHIAVVGEDAGEFRLADASTFADTFDEWSDERDELIAKRINDAYYDRYYDNDIYGADELTSAGQWTYVAGYGNAWQPYSSSISRWANWSPYRYGHWRWVGPYGWVWINDEPWGWATYHYGRWFYHHGRWYWSPYGYYRPRRSWWYPALVSITIFNNNTCWYPLGWRHRWRDYNRRYGTKPIRPRGPVVDPNGRTDIPITAVVSVPVNQFGARGARKSTVVDEPTFNAVLNAKDDVGGSGGHSLPDPTDVKRRLGRDITVIRPHTEPSPTSARTGAAIRKDKPLDDELRPKVILGGRPPIKDAGVKKDDGTTDRPPQGVFIRPPVKQQPVNAEPAVKDNARTDRPTEPTRPVYVPPAVKTEPRYTPPTTQKPAERPRYDPPVSRPRADSPQKPAQRSEPPAQKSEPKPVKKDVPAKSSGDAKSDKP